MGLRYLAERFAVEVPESCFSKLTAVPLSQDAIAKYYRTAGIVLPPLGNFPLLWYRYFKLEAQGSFVARLSSFPEYLAHAWGLPGKESIPSFILGKYRSRLTRWFAR